MDKYGYKERDYYSYYKIGTYIIAVNWIKEMGRGLFHTL